MVSVLFQHASKYFTASAISAVITLGMTKYYTVVFSPSEYGILAIYLVLFEYIRTLVSLNMDSGATRFYFDYRESKRHEYLSTIFWVISLLAVFVFIVSLFFMDTIVTWIAPGTEKVYVVTIVAGICAVYASFLMRILFNEQKSASVLKHTLVQTSANHLTSFFLISSIHFGILGRQIGQVAGYFLNNILLLKEFSKNNLFKLELTFNTKMAYETFMLSLPGTIASIQTIMFIYLDRIFIKHYMGDSHVGVYALGYMLGQGLSMVYEAISQAILPKVYKGLLENYERSMEEIESFSYRYYVGLILVTLSISLLSPFIVDMLSDKEYAQASNVMPFVMAGFMMGGFYKIPSLVLGYHKVVWFYPFLSVSSFGANALLNWYLIPKYGIVGAGLATFTGVFLYSAIMHYMVKKYMSVRYNYLISFLHFVIFAVVFGVFYG